MILVSVTAIISNSNSSKDSEDLGMPSLDEKLNGCSYLKMVYELKDHNIHNL